MQERIAIVEDEDDIRESLQILLEREDYIVSAYEDGTEALVGFKTEIPDIILLDWMLPKLSGIDILKILRNDQKFSKTGIIMVTAKSLEINIVDALNLGADDYIVKPFKKEELIARIKAVMRRYKISQGDSVEEKVVRFGEVWVNLLSYQAGDADGAFDLTPMEFKILSHFILNAGKLFTRNQIISQFWDSGEEVDERAVDVHIARLREKMKKSGKIIETVRGLGYRLREIK
ncbi:MAG: response regulator [Acidobacteriota bacterium]|nr:response regulator transcription factor [Thermoanaerobaculaceae bacterium]